MHAALLVTTKGCIRRHIKVAVHPHGTRLELICHPSDEDDVLERANALETGLGSSVWSKDFERATRMADQSANCSTQAGHQDPIPHPCRSACDHQRVHSAPHHVWSKDFERATRMADQLQSGSVWVNSHFDVAPNAPPDWS
jgi:hypothetical protein